MLTHCTSTVLLFQADKDKGNFAKLLAAMKQSKKVSHVNKRRGKDWLSIDENAEPSRFTENGFSNGHP